MKTVFSVLAILLVSCLTAQSLHFADHPTLTPDGTTIVFAHNGDLWRVSATGGNAVRLTALDGAESHPRISPDGKWLAFTSGQYGNADVYLTPLAGGPITQLTYHEADDEVTNWSWDSQTIYFSSNRYNRVSTFTVMTTGGTPRRLMDHYFNNPHNVAPVPGGQAFLFNESWESNNFTHRKGYKGPFNPEIKHFDPATATVKVLTDWEGKDMWPLVDRSGKTYFVSDRDNGEYNLYSLSKEGKTNRLTKYETSVFAPAISADGSRIVFIKDYELHTYDLASAKTNKVPVTLNAYAGLARTADFSTDGKISYFDVARDGKKLATVSRGELFVSDMEGKFVRKIETGPGRVMEVKWHKDGKTLIFTQTSNGYQNLFTVAADGSGQAEQRTRDARNNRNLEMSPDTSKIAYLSGRDELRVIDLKDNSVSTVAQQEIWGFQNSLPRWSPDGRYLMFTGYADFEQDIFLVDTRNDNQLFNLTQTGVTEADPVWSPDGKYIYFNSARHQPNYPKGDGNVNLYRLPLQKFDQPYRAEKFEELFAEKDTVKQQKDSVVIVEIDFENAMDRLEQVGPSFGTQSGAYVMKDGEKTLVLYGSNHEGKETLYKTTYEDFESPKTEQFSGSGVDNATDLVTAKGKHYLIGEGKVQKLDLKQKKWEAIGVKYTFRRNLEAEFTQMYYETWANMEENFYDGNFHGVDWSAMRDRYAAYLPYVTNRADLRRLTNDLLGELNTSHFGFRSSGKEEEIKQGARTLALGLLYSKDEPYLVAAILADGPADRSDVDLKPGDRILAIDGDRIAPARNRESYLSRPSIDGATELIVDRAGTEMTVRLHPVSYGSERDKRYDEWVDGCQRMVDEQTEQRIAYVHMKNMGSGELDNFLNEMVSEGHRREGLILDLRWNTGGNVHDDVLQFLSQRPYLKWQYRGGQLADQPNFAPAARPIILMINEQSLSDAEMTAAGFKELGLGTIVGMPTYRWIIFTSGKGLVDGSFYRLPSWGTYTLDGKNLEKTGVVPDVYIGNTAADREAGRDPQLAKAIELALKGLE